jgi:ribosomal protein S18 acetylase RimI-like enzyme
VIRKAASFDVSAISAVVQRAYQPYVERIGKPPAPMLDDYESLVGRGVVDVVELDGEIAGLVCSWRTDASWYIDNVAVDPDHHGAGVGVELMHHAEHLARLAGLHRIWLYTNEAMTENLGYYLRRGFVEFDRRDEAGYRRVYFEKHVEEMLQ